MRRHVWSIATLFLALPVCAAAQAQQPVTRPAEGVLSQMKNEVTAKGTIEAIDADRRVLTVKFDGGYSEVVSASPDVKRFSEVKVGDRVTVRYYESVVLMVRKAGDTTTPAPPASSDKSAGTPGTGANPGGTAARQRKATVTVVSIDKAASSITVKTPEGNTVTRKVHDPKNLEGVAAGDRIDITYTEAMLVNIGPTT
jgi:hypothetical protein